MSLQATLPPLLNEVAPPAGRNRRTKESRKAERPRKTVTRPDPNAIIQCPTCKRNLTSDNFAIDRNAPNGLKEQCRNCTRGNTIIQQHTLDGFIQILHRDLGKTARKKSIPITITPIDIKALYEAQNGLCHLTGFVMTSNSKTGGKRMPVKNISIDMFEPDKGYVAGNIRLVCSYITLGKEKLTPEERVKIAAALLN